MRSSGPTLTGTDRVCTSPLSPKGTCNAKPPSPRSCPALGNPKPLPRTCTMCGCTRHRWLMISRSTYFVICVYDSDAGRVTRG